MEECDLRLAIDLAGELELVESELPWHVDIGRMQIRLSSNGISERCRRSGWQISPMVLPRRLLARVMVVLTTGLTYCAQVTDQPFVKAKMV